MFCSNDRSNAFNDFPDVDATFTFLALCNATINASSTKSQLMSLGHDLRHKEHHPLTDDTMIRWNLTPFFGTCVFTNHVLENTRPFFHDFVSSGSTTTLARRMHALKRRSNEQFMPVFRQPHTQLRSTLRHVRQRHGVGEFCILPLLPSVSDCWCADHGRFNECYCDLRLQD